MRIVARVPGFFSHVTAAGPVLRSASFMGDCEDMNDVVGDEIREIVGEASDWSPTHLGVGVFDVDRRSRPGLSGRGTDRLIDAGEKRETESLTAPHTSAPHLRARRLPRW